MGTKPPNTRNPNRTNRTSTPQGGQSEDGRARRGTTYRTNSNRDSEETTPDRHFTPRCKLKERRAGLWGLLGAGVATCTPRNEVRSAVLWRLAISLAAGGTDPVPSSLSVGLKAPRVSDCRRRPQGDVWIYLPVRTNSRR
jgi:hypothetical protein